MVVAPIVGAPVVAAVVAGVVGAVVVDAVVAVSLAFDVSLVLSSAVRAHALLPLPISVATVVELAECRVQDARGVEEGLCVGLHAVVRAVAVKAMATVSTKGLSAGRASE